MRISPSEMARRAHVMGLLTRGAFAGRRHPDQLPRPDDMVGLPALARSSGGAVEIVGELATAYTAPLDTHGLPSRDVVAAGRRARRCGAEYVSSAHHYPGLVSDVAAVRMVMRGMGFAGPSLRTGRLILDQLVANVQPELPDAAVNRVQVVDSALRSCGSTISVTADVAADDAILVRISRRRTDVHTLTDSCLRLLHAGFVHGRLAAVAPGSVDDVQKVTHWETAVAISSAARLLATELLMPADRRSDVVAIAGEAGLPAGAFLRALPLIDELLAPLRARSGWRRADSSVDVSMCEHVPDPLGAVLALSDLLAVRDRR